MFSKFTKVKSCHPDKLYEALLESFFKEFFHSLNKVVLHHTMTTRDGTIIAAIEFRFEDKILFHNAHVCIDKNSSAIKVSNIENVMEYMR